MLLQKLRKVGNSYVVTIPKEEVERQKLGKANYGCPNTHPAEVRPVMTPELRKAFEESWQRNEPGYRYLAEH